MMLVGFHIEVCLGGGGGSGSGSGSGGSDCSVIFLFLYCSEELFHLFIM